MYRVAVIGLRGIPDVMGGIETHCSQLLPRLLSQVPTGELEITVLARKGYVAERATFDGVSQIPLWAPRRAALETIVHTFIALFYARFVLHASIVHLHAIGPGLLAPLARLLRFRLLFTHHGEDYRRQKWGRGSRLALQLGEVLAMRFAHQVITVSKASETRLRRRFADRAQRIVHIPNGLTRTSANPASDRLLRRFTLVRGCYVVSVGRLVPEKAQDLLIAAFRQAGLGRARPACKLLIIGASDHDSAYARRIEAEAATDETIILTGRQPRDVILSLNHAAGLFVLPSTHEGLSIAALEAISVGAPVLFSDIEENRFLGLPERNYFPTGSVDGLSRKLGQDFRTFAVPGDFDLDVYDWNRIARLTLERLDRVVVGKSLVRPGHEPAGATDRDT
ncbi:glycosyltransferase family 4 protein [Oceaniglobus indicus]|uniref:glycosyltransferase family 4 protein n=1 Tax=Oceaniglobus indicus TaxID=2047749 RepID=UPI001F4DFE94|nr:glycosyltransferase family 4 protein [Oceaniglobus indicus]